MKKLLIGVICAFSLQASWKDLSITKRREWVIRHFGKYEVERLEKLRLLEDGWLFEGRQPDSMNVRIVGRWPFGPTMEVVGDTLRNLVFQGSGSGVRILDISAMPNITELAQIAAPYAWLIEGLAVTDTILVVLQGADGFAIYGITDPANPHELSRTFIGQWLNDCFLKDSLLFIAGDDSLRIYNIKTPTSPQWLGGCPLPNEGHGIYVVGDYAYLACWNSGMYIYNISDPGNPQQVGVWPSGGIYCREIWVLPNHAYVATSTGLKIINVSNVNNPWEAGYFATDDCKGVFVLGSPLKFAYLAIAYGPWDYGLWVVDVSDSANPLLVDSLVSPGQGEEVWATKEAGPGAYVFLASHFGGLAVIDIADPVNPIQIDTIGVADDAYDLAVSGDYAYVADGFGCLKICDITVPTNIIEVGKYENLGATSFEAAIINDSTVYTGWVNPKFASIDVTDPTSPQLLDSLYPKTTFRAGICIKDTVAYMADVWAQAIDISNPAQLETLGSCLAAWYSSWGLFIQDSLLYIAQAESGLTICNFADPTAPYRFSSYVPGYIIFDVFVVDTLAYIAGRETGMHVLSVADPTAIYEISNHPISGDAITIFVRDTLAYVGADYFTVLNVSDITNIQTVGYYGISYKYGGPICLDSNYIYSANGGLGFTIFEYYPGSGIKESSSSKTKQVLQFQNPITKKVLNIQGVTSPLEVSIFSITGQKVSHQEVKPERPLITFNNLPSGVYFLVFDQRIWQEVRKVVLLR